jgi:hypothetical protein
MKRLARFLAVVLALAATAFAAAAADYPAPKHGEWIARDFKFHTGLPLIPASAETRGHGTTAFAKFWKQQLQELLAAVPRRPA